LVCAWTKISAGNPSVSLRLTAPFTQGSLPSKAFSLIAVWSIARTGEPFSVTVQPCGDRQFLNQ
jgi:hypothetical protein